MNKLIATTAFALVLAGSVLAQDSPNLDGNTLHLFADGTWDCRDSIGEYIGAVVIADLSYAFIGPDDAIGTYGKLNKDDWVDAPGFIILSGEVKDKFGGVGMYVRGPLDTPNDFKDHSKLRLQIVITEETYLQCARRTGPAM